MAGRAPGGPCGPETVRKKQKAGRTRQKGQSRHRSTLSRLSGLFYSRVLVLGGDTPTGDALEKVGRLRH
jgi:hypothetical protein